MSSRIFFQTAVTLLFLSLATLTLAVNAESTSATETVPPPGSVVAQRYSHTAAEIFWARPATFGLRYDISRDGTLLTNTDGVSYYDKTLSAESSPTYTIVAINRQGQRSLPSSITVPPRNTTAEPLAPPASVTAIRYSATAGEIFWLRPATFGLRYDISRDGTFLSNIGGVSYFDNTLIKGKSVTYTITAIDRQGRRSSPSSVNVPATTNTNPEPVDSLITLDSYEQILQELVKLINATPLYDTLSTQPAITDAGVTFISVSTDPVEDEVFGFGFVYDYSCDAGGSIEQFRFTEPGSFKYTFADCALETGSFNGILKEFGSGRDGSGISATDFAVDTDEQTRTLSGTTGTSIFRGVAGLKRDWIETDFEARSTESTLTLSSYKLDASSAYDPGSSINTHELLVSFDVTAPWTEEQRIHVEATLQANVARNTAFTWQTGQVVAVADDGSQLTLTPADAVQRTFNVALSGSEELITRQWSESFEIYCAFTDIDTCGNF